MIIINLETQFAFRSVLFYFCVTMNNNGIVVVGSCMIDFISYASKLPKEGETVLGTKFVTGFGGKGANQCAAAAKLGGNTSFVARLGDDTWGADYLKVLNSLKINTKHIQLTPGQSSGIAQITVDDLGQNQIVVVGGANGKLCEDDITKASDVLTNTSVLVCQLETPVEVALKAIHLCKGISILNGAPALSKYDPKLLSSPSIFCVNETEAAVFTGLPVENISNAKIALESLLDKGCNTVILTLGSEGALLGSKTNRNIVHITSPKVTTVDTTGAGDAFIGALAYLMAEFQELSMEKRIEIACEMAANSVTKQGTQISFPDKEVLENYLKTQQI